MRITLEEFRATASEWVRDQGAAEEEASALVEALGLPLLHELDALARVVVAADGFHPVARFFAEGSDEWRAIEQVLGDAARHGEAGREPTPSG